MTRNREKGFLGLLLLCQLLMLGYQVRRSEAGGARLLHVWGFSAVVPVEKATHHVVVGIRNVVHSYFVLVHVQRDNQRLQSEIERQQLEITQLRESVRELPHLNALLGFQSGFSMRTQPAQVIGSGASPDAQVIYIDRGGNVSIARNMPVIVPAGVVGKVSQVSPSYSQVLLLTDPDSGVGALAGDTSIHGILHGLGDGTAELRLVLNGESIPVGAKVITSGEDQVYPKGLVLGTVTSASNGAIFQNIHVKLAADLARLESVLVITGQLPTPAEQPVTGQTAAQIRQSQLPSVPAANAGLSSGTTSTVSSVAAAPGAPLVEGDALQGAAVPKTASPKPSADPKSGGGNPPLR